MEDRCAFLEEEVPRVEAALAHPEEQVVVYVSAAETQRLAGLAAELRGQLPTLTAEWEALMAQLERAYSPTAWLLRAGLRLVFS